MMSAVKPEPALRDQQLIEAVQIFRDKFSSNPDVAVFAPGRANLIGEHTDYNEGYVLPFALPYKTIIVASKTVNAECVVYSTAIDEMPAIFSADKTLSQGDPEWANYVKGVVYQYLDDLPHDGVSFNAVIVSNVPVGSGLSSSAAIEYVDMIVTFILSFFLILFVTFCVSLEWQQLQCLSNCIASQPMAKSRHFVVNAPSMTLQTLLAVLWINIFLPWVKREICY